MIRLRHLVTIANSNVDKVTNSDEIPVRLCNYVDVYKNDRITDDMAFMAASATRTEINKFGLKVGDVIITKDSEDRSDIAVPAYVSKTAPDLVCGYHLALLRGRPQLISGAFLFWALQSKRAREAFSNAAGGVTRFGLTLDGMKSVVLPCPDRETQEAITDFLDCETIRIDQLIEKKQRLLELLAEKQMITVSKTVIGEEIGPLKPLKHVCDINPEVLPENTDSDFEFDYIDIRNVTLEKGIIETERMRFGAAPRRARKPVRRGLEPRRAALVNPFGMVMSLLPPLEHISVLSRRSVKEKMMIGWYQLVLQSLGHEERSIRVFCCALSNRLLL